MTTSIYKDVLMDHYRHPRNRSDMGDADVVRRGSNPRCGDDLEIGVIFDANTLKQVIFRGRGCSVCLASASMMTEAVTKLSREQADRLYQDMKSWFSSGEEHEITVPPPLNALDAVRQHPARRRCVLLAWEALHEALSAR